MHWAHESTGVTFGQYCVFIGGHHHALKVLTCKVLTCGLEAKRAPQVSSDM